MSKMHEHTAKITVELTADCLALAKDGDDYEAHMRKWCENEPMNFFQHFISVEPKIVAINDVRKVN